MTERRIENGYWCNIPNYIGEEGIKAVNVVFDDGSTESPLFTYYDNEVAFTADEFLGMTREAAMDLHIAKRRAFVERMKGG